MRYRVGPWSTSAVGSTRLRQTCLLSRSSIVMLWAKFPASRKKTKPIDSNSYFSSFLLLRASSADTELQKCRLYRRYRDNQITVSSLHPLLSSSTMAPPISVSGNPLQTINPSSALWSINHTLVSLFALPFWIFELGVCFVFCFRFCSPPPGGQERMTLALSSATLFRDHATKPLVLPYTTFKLWWTRILCVFVRICGRMYVALIWLTGKSGKKGREVYICKLRIFRTWDFCRI